MSDQSRPLHVLVLDDDEKILRLLKIFMRQLGYRVTTAQNGREGIRKMLRHRFDLVIVDVQMPVVDGFEFAEEVLRLWPWEKLILCTGFLDEDVEARSKSLGIEAILKKPISFNTLESAIQRVFAPDTTENGTPAESASPSPQAGCELSHLREFTHEVMDHHQFGEAIAGFTPTLLNMIPCAAAGVFGLHGEYGRFAVSSDHPVDPEFLELIRKRICSHLEFFSGEPLPCVPLPEQRILHSRRSPVMEVGHQVLMTPVAGGRDAVGMLFLIVPETSVQPPPELNLLHVCAHHLSTVLECLEQSTAGQIRDALTGLYSWTYLEVQVQEAWRQMKHDGTNIGWLDVDLTQFKTINDTQGFFTGDAILKDVAGVIENHLQEGELCGRRGADEFCVLVRNATQERMEELGHFLMDGVGNLQPSDLESHPVGCAIGTAATFGDHGITSASQLVECSEHARFVAERREGTQLVSWADLKASGEASITLHPILVVDDDPQICVLIKRILNRNMYEVTGAESVAEAMSMLERGKRYEVMLTDLALPHQDGTEMIRLGYAVDPDMIPIVISGNISKDSEGKLREQGAHEIIKKPFEPTQLRQIVQNAVELYRRAQRKTETV